MVHVPQRRTGASAVSRPRIAACGGVALALLFLSVAPGHSQTPPRPAPAAVLGAYGSSWALVVGINRYERVRPRLNYAVRDARALADALPNLGFPREQIRVLLDGEATKARIEGALYREFTRSGPQDRLLVFLAGHGETLSVRGGEEGFFLPADADPEALPLTALAMEDLKRIGRRLPAKHILFLVDACFSGFAVARATGPEPVTDHYLATVLREPVVQIITAGRKGEQAIEEGGHGIFTRRLLEGLRGLVDVDGRGFITAQQLAAWLEPRVVRDSDGRMHPQYGKLDGEGQFVFPLGASAAARPAAVVPGVSAPPAAVAPRAPPVVDVSGVWTGNWVSQGEPSSGLIVLTLRQVDMAVTGHVRVTGGEHRNVDGRVGGRLEGDRLILDHRIDVEITVDLRIRGDAMNGTFNAGSGGYGTLSLRRDQ